MSEAATFTVSALSKRGAIREFCDALQVTVLLCWLFGRRAEIRANLWCSEVMPLGPVPLPALEVDDDLALYWLDDGPALLQRARPRRPTRRDP